MEAFRRRHPPGAVIYIARDARDSLLSYYFFRQAYAKAEELETQKINGTEVLISRGGAEPVFQPDDFSAFLRAEAPAWAAHVASARRDGDLCFLTYEELMRNFEPSLARALAHRGRPRSRSYEETNRVYHTGFGAVFAGNNPATSSAAARLATGKTGIVRRMLGWLDQLIGPELLRISALESDPAGPPPAFGTRNSRPPRDAAPTANRRAAAMWPTWADYAGFCHSAKADTTGYEAAAILEAGPARRCTRSCAARATYEQDSVTFDTPDLPGPLLEILNRIAAGQAGRLSVLDFLAARWAAPILTAGAP